MKRNPLLSVAPVLVLILAALFAGCGGSDKGTNPAQVTEPFESGTLPNGAIFVRTFNNAGSFTYRCRIHGGMSGVINVAAAGADSPDVIITNNSFAAAPTLKAGSYVKWVNQGSDHTVSRP